MEKRKYSGEIDLKLLQEFNAAAIAVTDHCGYLHPCLLYTSDAADDSIRV